MSKPDYVLKVKAREGKYGVKVGAAWKTRNGDGLNIRLDPGIAIVGGEGIDITLWPFEEREGGGRPRSSGGRSGGGGFEDFPKDDFGADGDIPFATSAFAAGTEPHDPCRGLLR